VLAHCFCLRDAETKARVVFGLSGCIGDQNGGVAMLVRATVLCAVLAGALASGSVGVARAKTGVLPSPEVVFSPAEGANISAGVASDGADGVWFSDLEPSGAYLEHYAPGVTPSGVTVPTGEGLNGQVFAIAPGTAGSEAFAQTFGSRLYDISVTDTLSSSALPEDTSPYDFVFDSQGDLWLTNYWAACSVDRVTPLGEVTSTYLGGNTCRQLAIGPEGNIWVAVNLPTMAVVKLSAQTGAILATYALPSEAMGIASTAGRVWVTEAESSAIASITPSGEITQHKLPAGRDPEWLTVGPDGALWFIEGNGSGGVSLQHGGIGRMTVAGVLSEVALPGESHATEIAATRDALYFTAGSSLMRIETAPPPEGVYVALGDSYSSGEGNPPYELGTNTEGETPDKCHRSAAAYGPLLSEDLALAPMTFKACSGAVTNDIFEPNATNPAEPAQLSWLRSDTKTVTLTIGGDDAGFVPILERCVAALPVRLKEFLCSTDQELEQETQARLTALAGGAYATTPPPVPQPIHSVLSVIKAIHAKALSARIYIGLYPLLFGERRNDYSDLIPHLGLTAACEVGLDLWIGYKDALWLNRLGDELDTYIIEAVSMATGKGISVTAVKPRFSGHGFCDRDERWFYPIEFEAPLKITTSSFHPTEHGQQMGYEAAFAAKIK
jgi:streptogramin lyase